MEQYYGHSAGSFKYPWPHKLPTASYLYLPAILHQSATELGSRGASSCQTVRWTWVYCEYLSYSLSAWYGFLTKDTLLNGARRMVYLSLCFRVHVTQVPLQSAYGILLIRCYNISHTCNIFDSWCLSIFCASLASSKSAIEWNHKKIRCRPSVIPFSCEYKFIFRTIFSISTQTFFQTCERLFSILRRFHFH